MIPIPIRGTARGSAGAAFEIAKRRGAQRLDFTRDYLVALYADAAARGVNADVLVAQWDLETDAGRSAYWQRDGNPAGLAAFDDGSNWGLTFTPQTAARAHVVHMCAYAGIDVPEDWRAVDARWDAVTAAGYAGTVSTTDDLGNGRWATDPAYAAKLLGRYVAYWGEPAIPTKEPAMATFGNVPPIRVVDRQFVTATKPPGNGWDDLGTRDVLGVVLHRMLGSLRGTDSFFRTANALTDYGLGVEATDGKDLAGVLYQWNDPFGRRSGWASGPVSKPYGDGKAFVDAYGINAVNRRLVSIEISGQQETPVDAVAWRALVHFVASWADRCKVPWETFPLNPATGISFVIWHQEFTIGTGKECPFAWVMDNTDRLIADVKAMLQRYQTGATQPVSPPDPPTSATAYVRAVKEILVRAAPDVNARVGFVLAAGEVAAVIDPTPRTGSGLSWIDVRVEGRGTGFVPVGDIEASAAPAPPPPPQPKGATFRTRYRLPLRGAPGFGGAITGDLAEGTAGEILEGPRDADGIGWYRVRLAAGEGWVPASIVRTLEIDG